MKIVSRAEAKEQGLKRYFTGKPCKRGHVCERYLDNSDCCRCRIDRANKWNKDNGIRRKAIAAAYVKRFPNRRKVSCKNWQQNNRSTVLHGTRKYQLAKLNRTPPWADLEAIKQFYTDCPKGHHVDHYYPLQGETCSGLHVLENLRHIPAKENISKGNKMPEEFYA